LLDLLTDRFFGDFLNMGRRARGVLIRFGLFVIITLAGRDFLVDSYSFLGGGDND
jgi:hypothetical protein